MHGAQLNEFTKTKVFDAYEESSSQANFDAMRHIGQGLHKK